MDKERQGYVVLVNTDSTEGKGSIVPLLVCDTRSTAKRLAKGKNVQGSPGEVRPVDLLCHAGFWYGPVQILLPTDADIRAEEILEKREFAIQAAREAGLTEEQIDAIRRYFHEG